MAESIEIPVTFRGQELSFKAELQKLGYIYRIQVDVNGANVAFEREEEGSFKAFLNTYEASKHNIDIALVQASG
jgi:hypothetical protein